MAFEEFKSKGQVKNLSPQEAFNDALLRHVHSVYSDVERVDEETGKKEKVPVRFTRTNSGQMRALKRDVAEVVIDRLATYYGRDPQSDFTIDMIIEDMRQI